MAGLATSASSREAWRSPALRREPPDAPARGDVVAALLADAISRDGEVLWHATGRSMAGSIRDGTTLRLVSPRARPPMRDDVVAAVLPDGSLVVHRVQQLSGELLLLRGDACRRNDPPVDVGSVIGVADPCPPRNWRSLIRRYMP